MTMIMLRGLLRLLLSLCLLASCANAFSNYLVTKSGCWTELSVEEAIMGASVVSVDQQDGSTYGMHIVVDGETESTSSTVELLESELPKTLSLQLLAAQTLPAQSRDYQWAMDVHVVDDEQAAPVAASFVHGGCDNNKRISGKDSQKVELIIQSLPVTILAGWAAGHEAVKLVPSLAFVAKKNADAAEVEGHADAAHNQREHEEQQHAEPQHPLTDWTSLLLSSNACGMGNFDNPTIESLLQEHHMTIHHETDKYQLALHKMEGSIPARATLQFKGGNADLANSDDYQLVLETTPGASFEHGSCDDQRRIHIARNAGNRQEAWPSLMILESIKPIVVSGWMSFQSSSEQPTKTTRLHRIQPFKLEWHTDPQKHVDSISNVEMAMQRQIQQHQSGEKRDVADEKGKLKVPDIIQAETHRHNNAIQTRDSHGFVVGPRWYIGMFILLATPCFVLPFCLHVSKPSRRKGRLSKAN